jgi:hypothetical protein
MTRLALSVAVMSQVHLAYLNYRDLLNQFKLALKSYQIRQRLADIAEKVGRGGEFHGGEVLSFKTDAILAKMNLLRVFGSLKISQGQINYAIGQPFYFGFHPEEYEETSKRWDVSSDCERMSHSEIMSIEPDIIQLEGSSETNAD